MVPENSWCALDVSVHTQTRRPSGTASPDYREFRPGVVVLGVFLGHHLWQSQTRRVWVREREREQRRNIPPADRPDGQIPGIGSPDSFRSPSRGGSEAELDYPIGTRFLGSYI